MYELTECENRAVWLHRSKQIEQMWKETVQSYITNSIEESCHKFYDYSQVANDFKGVSPFDPEVNGVAIPEEILSLAIANSSRPKKYLGM